MSKLKDESVKARILNKVTLFAVLLYSVILFLNYAKYVQGDFGIYFRAGARLANGEKIYNSDQNLYVYGPLLAHILSIFSFLNDLQISRIWLFLNIFITPFSLFLFFRYVMKPKFHGTYVTLFFAVLVVSFSYRNNAGNGSVMAMVLLGALLIYLSIEFQMVTRERNKLVSISLDLMAAFSMVSIVEIKTYLAIWIGIFVLLFRRKIIGISFLLILVENAILIIRNEESYLMWFEALRGRSKSITSGDDQATIVNFVQRLLGGNFKLTYLVVLVIVAILLYVILKNLRIAVSEREHSKAFLIVTTSSLVITPFAHGQDFLLDVVVLLVLLLVSPMDPSSNVMLAIACALLINWTNTNLILGQLSLILLYLALIQSRCFSKKTLMLSSILSESILILNKLFGSNKWLDPYIFYNFQALIFGLLILFMVLREGAQQTFVNREHR